MRALAGWILVLALSAAPAMAGTGGAGENKDSSAKSSDNSAAAENTGKPAADAPKAEAPAAPTTPAAPSMENQIQQLRDLVEAQSRQIQAQNEQLRDQQRKMYQMEDQLRAVNTTMENNGLGVNPAASAGALSYNDEKKPDEPIAIKYKGVTLTPGGFFAAETVWRQHGLTNDVNTDFKAIPMPGQTQSRIGEFNFSGRQSRISMKGEGKLADIKLTGYYEGDFLSAGITSNNNQSNSYTFRQRQFWGQAAWDNGLKITGGQMWSLVTETKHGLDNLTEATPLTIDAQYTVGFSWARQYGFRVVKGWGDKFWLGMSIEGAQTTLGGKIQNDTTLIAAPGDSGGLFNPTANYSYNTSPDIIIKGAWEPGFGHYEVFGIISSFKARLYPCAAANALNPCVVDGSVAASSIGASNDTTWSGGFGANARWSLFSKHLDFGLHFIGGDGVGRYGTTTLSDVTVRPDGSLVPLRSYHALGTLELHPNSKLDIYGYGGIEYDGRATYIAVRQTALGVFTNLPVGYGSPLLSNAGCSAPEPIPGNQNTPGALGSCQQDNRSIVEGTLGFWYRFYTGPKGRMQAGMQYSYATRNVWGDALGNNPHGVENMFFTSLRYYLP